MCFLFCMVDASDQTVERSRQLFDLWVLESAAPVMASIAKKVTA